MSLVYGEFLLSVNPIGIPVLDINGKSIPHWIATGFVVIKNSPNNKEPYIPFIITNKHVIQNCQKIYIKMYKGNNYEQTINEIDIIKNDKKIYYTHCKAEVDIVAIPIFGNGIANNTVLSPINLETMSMDSHAINKDYGIGALGVSVYMLGFPMGLVDDSTSIPICRNGCIARYTNKISFIVDIQNYPGNSGSPIILHRNLNGKLENKLIGIVNSYIPYTEQLLNSQTKRVDMIKTENSGLANAYSVDCIKEIVNKAYIEEVKKLNL